MKFISARVQFFTAAWLICLVSAAYALDPNRTITQYSREVWGTKEGFPGSTVYGIAQTPDGYLWIASEKGLVRFDGLSFQLVQSGKPAVSSSEPVVGLIGDIAGNLWLRLGNSMVLRYRDGNYNSVLLNGEQDIINVSAMSRAADGQILLTTLANDLQKNNEENLLTPLIKTKLPKSIIISMTQIPKGDIWLGTRDDGLLRVSADDGEISRITDGLPDRKVNCLLPDGGDGLWVGTDQGLVYWNGEKLTRLDVPGILNKARILTMLKDRDSNIWLGTGNGLVRLNHGGIISSEVTPMNDVTSLFEDREGNLWSGNSKGIERFRDSTFSTFSVAEGLPSDKNGAIFVDAENRTWFAPLAGGLYFLEGNQIKSVLSDGLADDIVYSIAGDDKNDLWVGRQRGGLTHLHFNGSAFTAKTYTPKDGLAQTSVYAVHCSRDGTIWAGTLSGGASHLADGVFTTYTRANGLAENSIAAFAESVDGATMWLATPTGLRSFKNGNWRNVGTSDGLPSENVISLLSDSSGVLWIGTERGLAFIDSSGQVKVLPEIGSALPHEPVFGLAEDKNDSLWVSTANHVFRVERENLLNGSITAPNIRQYVLADGLNAIEGVRRNRSVVADSTGRVWFSLNRGISMVNANRIVNTSIPALVQIQSIFVDGKSIELKDNAKLQPARHRLALSYVGLSFSMPERVKYRYRLEGFDKGWSEPTASREAVYTNLSPGSYSFYVVASNGDGVWNSNEAVVRFEIEPEFWQTWWFRGLCAAAAALVITVFYQFRLRYVTKRLNTVFEERLAERTRIAQELHDSLLQGVVSASMQLNVAFDNLPDNSPEKQQLLRVVELMGEVTTEGRNTLRGLRSNEADGSGNIEKAFANIRQDPNNGKQAEFRIIVEGTPRSLRSIVRDEVYFVGREALLNSYRHSHADNIEIIIEYTAKHLRISVRDDGHGIDSSVLKNGREGHWGLVGMRERTERIGGRLKVWSRSGAGTEIDLIVPNRIAFETETLNRPVVRLFNSFALKLRSRLQKRSKGNDGPKKHHQNIQR